MTKGRCGIKVLRWGQWWQFTNMENECYLCSFFLGYSTKNLKIKDGFLMGGGANIEHPKINNRRASSAVLKISH
jgi:hypothetical protein